MKFLKIFKPLLELNSSKFQVIALTGGRGSTKTGHALRGILTCSMMEKKKTCFFRETKDTLDDSIKAELESIIESDFPNRGYAQTKSYVSHINGSKMIFKGLKDVNTNSVENLKGIASTTDFFVIDEAQSVSKSVWDVLIPTLRKAGCVLIVIYNRIDDELPVEEALFLDYNTMSAPEGTYFIEFNYTDIDNEKHKLLSRQFLNRAELIKKNRPDEYSVIYLNKPARGNENYVFKYFSDNNICELSYQDDLPLYLSCDFNVDPMSWCVFHMDEENIYIIDEIIVENVTTRACAEEFIRRYPSHKGKIILGGDASGDSRKTQSEYSDFAILQNMLKKHGYKDVTVKIHAGNPYIMDRVAAAQNMVQDIYDNVHLFISNKCKNIIKMMKNIKYKEGTRILDKPTHTQIKNSADKTLKYQEHIFDAVTYPCEYYFPIKVDKKNKK